MSSRIMLVLFLLGVCGCGSSESVITGTVTVNDQPLAQGHITFFPVDDRSNTFSSEVVDGQYKVKGMQPGARKVLVSETPAHQVVQAGKGPPVVKLLKSPNAVTPNTRGNQQVVTIAAGKHTLDIALHTNPSSPR